MYLVKGQKEGSFLNSICIYNLDVKENEHIDKTDGYEISELYNIPQAEIGYGYDVKFDTVNLKWVYEKKEIPLTPEQQRQKDIEFLKEQNEELKNQNLVLMSGLTDLYEQIATLNTTN